ncbi:MAG TPA: GNAT family N-acetyltransferase [Ktedonobacteraceae bacterium]|nr:GNAT family N-acetyltransferase [Ktedonobacteraceae bacterium]
MSTTLPAGFTVRPATMEDIRSIAAIFIARETALFGVTESTVDSMAEWILTVWQSPHFELEKDSWGVFASDGTAVGYVTLWRPELTPLQMYGSPRILPTYRGLGLTTFLLHAAETRARELMQEVATDVGVTLTSWTETADEAAQQLLVQEGYQPLRYYWRMELEMDAPPPLPVWPDGISVRTFVPGLDNRATYEAMDEGFRDSWGYEEGTFEEWERYGIATSDFDPSLWFLAMDGNEIVGAALCRHDVGETAHIGWIDELAIRPNWRKRGLAMALLHHAFREFYQRDILKCGLTVDSENVSGATRLCERAGMHRSNKSDIRYQKVLRELRKE